MTVYLVWHDSPSKSRFVISVHDTIEAAKAVIGGEWEYALPRRWVQTTREVDHWTIEPWEVR